MNALTRQEIAQLDAPVVRFELERPRGRGAGQPRRSSRSPTREGIEIPRLCYKPGLDEVGNCRACMVEIAGERVLAPSCCRTPTPGMKVTTDSERALKSQKLVLELLLSDMPEAEYTRHNEVDEWAAQARRRQAALRARARRSRPTCRTRRSRSTSTPCIQCTRCVRACRDEQVNDVIGLAFRGDDAKIVFDMDDPMGDSTCVACGECVQACPTGALMPARDVGARGARQAGRTRSARTAASAASSPTTSRTTRSSTSNGRDGPANHGRLCVKGRYGFDYAHHPQRLRVAADPPRRRAQARRRRRWTRTASSTSSARRPGKKRSSSPAAAWRDLRDAHGPKALAGFGSAKGSNEEAYLFQKLVRTGFRQQQRRPLHAPVPRIERRRAARGHRLGRGLEPGDGRRPRPRS